MRLALLVIILPGLSMAAEIPQGAHALLRLVNSVSTRTAREGDYVYLRTAWPIVVNGQIIVPAESTCRALYRTRNGAGGSRAVPSLGFASRH